jgi:hypothetical protein
MPYSIAGALAACTVLSVAGCRTESPPVRRLPISATNCSFEQVAQLERSFEGICRSVHDVRGECRQALTRLDALDSFERQCRRGLTVRCAEPRCGQYFRRNLLVPSDDGTIQMGRGGIYGGRGCGGYERPTLGPAHTLTHEMAHAAGIVADSTAEQVAYACRGAAAQPLVLDDGTQTR